jgi:hypothetical protein
MVSYKIEIFIIIFNKNYKRKMEGFPTANAIRQKSDKTYLDSFLIKLKKRIETYKDLDSVFIRYDEKYKTTIVRFLTDKGYKVEFTKCCEDECTFQCDCSGHDYPALRISW